MPEIEDKLNEFHFPAVTCPPSQGAIQGCDKARLRSVAYVIGTFPVPSETFIADEALSLFEQGIQPCILYMNYGNLEKIHPSAQSLLKRAKFFQFGTASILKAALALAHLFLVRPVRTVLVLKTMLHCPNRYCFIKALPAAVWCLHEKVGFLHAHFADVNFIYAGAISAWSGIPFGVTTHRYDIFEEPIEKSTATDLFFQAAIVVTISKFNRLHMMQKYGIPESKIDVIHCGVDLDRFTFNPRVPRQGDQPIRLVNVGRMVLQKAHDVLLVAMSILRAQGHSFKLEIIGDGPLSEELKVLARKLDIADSVVFHGVKTQEFLIERISAADLFVLSSRHEGLPVVCIEALAVGTVVVATRVFGVPELIEDGVNGFLSVPDDPQALANTVLLASADPLRMGAIAVAGRLTVLAEFERKACTKQLIELWTTATARSKL